MIFGKKHHKEESRELPVDEVKNMGKKGMTDHEIIKTLKSKGYSYEEIEKAMLHAVKTGVEQQEAPPPQRRPNFEDFSTPPSSAPQEDFTMNEMPEFETLPTEQEQSPELMMEELIESVMEDKISRYESEIKKLKESVDAFKNDMKALEQKISETKPSQSESVNQEFADQLDDLQARVGGLERAFKQFLPSLTKNIEALSKMIHEMKQKHVEQPTYQ